MLVNVEWIQEINVIFIESAPSEEEHNIQEEIKMMSSVGNHENVVGLLRICVSEREPLSHIDYLQYNHLFCYSSSLPDYRVLCSW